MNAVISLFLVLFLVVIAWIGAAAGLVGYTGYLGAEVVRPGHLSGLF